MGIGYSCHEWGNDPLERNVSTKKLGYYFEYVPPGLRGKVRKSLELAENQRGRPVYIIEV